jgi:hypothetical protein
MAYTVASFVPIASAVVILTCLTLIFSTSDLGSIATNEPPSSSAI